MRSTGWQSAGEDRWAHVLNLRIQGNFTCNNVYSIRAIERLRNQRRCIITRSWIITTVDPAGGVAHSCYSRLAPLRQSLQWLFTNCLSSPLHHPPSPPLRIPVADSSNPGHKAAMRLQSRRQQSHFLLAHTSLTPRFHFHRIHLIPPPIPPPKPLQQRFATSHATHSPPPCHTSSSTSEACRPQPTASKSLRHY
jgi:hypothetical protein